jgi:hypothetical protein
MIGSISETEISQIWNLASAVTAAKTYWREPTRRDEPYRRVARAPADIVDREVFSARVEVEDGFVGPHVVQ